MRDTWRHRVSTGLSAGRGYLGWLAVCIGIVLEILGWFGVSGQNIEARQLPYLASASIPGAALIVAGAVLIGLTGRVTNDPVARQIADLHALLLEPVTDDLTGTSTAGSQGSAPGRKADAGFLAVPGGTTYHRPSCELTDKPEAEPVTAQQIIEHGLKPCPVCEPPDAEP